MVKSAVQHVPPRLVADHLLSHGRPLATLADVQDLTGLGASAAAEAMARARRAGHVFSPARGVYVPIPPAYRSWGVIPAMDFIDPLMTVMGRTYYVALLSAAELYGAAHQRPQAFQVMVSQPVPDRDLGRVRLRFYTRVGIGTIPTVSRNSATGTVRVSSPAATVLDLTARPTDAGGLSNVATVVAELVEETRLDARAIIDAAPLYPDAALRRLGWLLDLTQAMDTADLATVAPTPPRPVTMLDPNGPRSGPGNRKWGVVENAVVEPDL